MFLPLGKDSRRQLQPMRHRPMIQDNDPRIKVLFDDLLERINSHGVKQWTEERDPQPDQEGLTYLCKFGYFTGILTKGEIAGILDIDRPTLKKMVKSWYDDHREKGCGTC